MPLPDASPHAATAMPQRSYPLALTVVTVVFFMWGLLTSLNDILIPHLKSIFQLGYGQAMLVQLFFFGAYFIMSLPAGKIISRTGYKHSIVIGLTIAGLGALMFWPAAGLRNYPLFLLALFVLASGITLLQVAANPYVTLLGPERSASSRINLAQALNALGTALGPHFGGLLILGVAVLSATQLAALPDAEQYAYQAQQAHAVQGPYLGLAISLFVLAALFWLFRMPALQSTLESKDQPTHSIGEVLARRHVLLGVIAIFVYVGAEVSVSSFIVNYLSLPEIGHMSEQRAASYVSFYWTGAMIGRLVGSPLMLKFNPGKLLGSFALINCLLVLTTLLSSGALAMWSIIALGLFNSIMFPTIFSLGIAKLGPMTSKASSLLIMAIVGGALIPCLQGLLADHIGIQHAFVLPLLCYLYIAFYGFKGSHVA